MMKLTRVIVYTAIISMLGTYGCKKETYEDLYGRADLKIQEAVKLTQGHACTDLKEWRIDTLYYTYVPVHPSFEKQYLELLAEAKELKRRARDLRKDPLVYDTSPIYLPPHFGLRCINGTVKVAKATDLDLTEINQRLDQLFPEITHFFDDVPCDKARWGYRMTHKGCAEVAVFFTEKPNFISWARKFEEYNHLEAAKRAIDKSLNCPDPVYKPVKEIICENGKPKAIY